MKKQATTQVCLLRAAMLVVALCCSFVSFGQSTDAHELLKIPPVEDDDSEMVKIDSVIDDQSDCCLIKKNAWCRFLYADIGGSDIIDKVNNNYSSATGLTWAVSANEAYKIRSLSKNYQALFSAGLELRNYNGVASIRDRQGAVAYDNLHYWYAGIPLIYQVINTRFTPGKKREFRYYGQVGVTIGLMLRVNDAYSDQGSTYNYNISNHYTTFMVQPFVSAGVTYKTPSCTYMLGPYAGYVANNIVSNTAISEHIFSFGLRLTTLFLHY